MKILSLTLMGLLLNTASSHAGTWIICSGKTAEQDQLKVVMHYNNDSDIASKEIFDAVSYFNDKAVGIFSKRSIKETSHSKTVKGYHVTTVTGTKQNSGFSVMIPDPFFRFGLGGLKWKTDLKISGKGGAHTAKNAICTAKLDFEIDGIQL